MKQKNELLELPPCVTRHIFDFLPKEDLKNIACVNKKYNDFFKPTMSDSLQIIRYRRKQEGIVKFYTKYTSQFAVQYFDGHPVLLASGNNSCGALGLFGNQWIQELGYCPLPHDVKKIEDIAIGRDHTLILYEDGQQKKKILSTGGNHFGQLGENKDNRNIFSSMNLPEGLKNPVGICAGQEHTHIWGYDENGELQIWASGLNTSGQLGLGHTGEQLNFALCPEIDDLQEITSMSAGEKFTMICGKNKQGQPQVWMTRKCYHQYTWKSSLIGLVFPSDLAIGEIKQTVAGSSHAMIWTYDKQTNKHRLFVESSLGFHPENAPDVLTELPFPDDSLAEVRGISVSRNRFFIWGIDKEKQYRLWSVDSETKTWTLESLPSQLAVLSHVHSGDNLLIQGTDKENKPQIFDQYHRRIKPPALSLAVLLNSPQLSEDLKQHYCAFDRYLNGPGKSLIFYRRSHRRIRKAIEHCLIDLKNNQLTLKKIEEMSLQVEKWRVRSQASIGLLGALLLLGGIGTIVGGVMGVAALVLPLPIMIIAILATLLIGGLLLGLSVYILSRYGEQPRLQRSITEIFKELQSSPYLVKEQVENSQSVEEKGEIELHDRVSLHN